jgi:heterodisulfide reductase subunit C2
LNYLNSGDLHQFRKQVLSLSGEDVARCIQCGKCSAGCPVSQEMDLQPNQVIRMIQINDSAAALQSGTIWLCASCQTCSVRCPEKIDIAAIMDSLRKICLEGRVHAGEDRVVKFDEIFLDSIRKRGRVHELDLVMRYNLALRRPLKDAHLGPTMFARGKLALLGDKIKELGNVREIFSKSKRFMARNEGQQNTK